MTEREKRWQNRLASRQRGTQSEGPAGPLMWVTGSLVARLTRCGRSIVIQRDRRRGSVETMISSTSSRLASLRIASTRSGINDLAVSLRAGLAKPGQLLLQPPLGQGPGDLVGAWDHPPIEPAAGPPIGGLGLGHRSYQIEAAGPGVHGFGDL